MRYAVLFALTLVAAPAAAQTPAPAATTTVQAAVKAQVPGITNFSRVETTVACAGATTPEALAQVKKMGFRSVINLRQPTEPGANVEAEAAAAKAAGIAYVALPFNAGAPDPAVADEFLKVVADPANQPAFIHCASGQRAAAMWMIKRMVADGWDAERAGAEAAGLGLSSVPLKTFALSYAASHKP